jgi:tetratricopeptide (TPR) repeat protein
LAAYVRRWAQHRQRLAEQLPDGASLRTQALLTLRFLHHHVLKGSYRADATAVHRTLDDGDYNCVSATILYRCLWPAGAAPLATISEEHHVYCRLVAEPPTDIQTTSARGFPTAVDLDELTAAVASREGPRTSRQKPARTILDGQLVAKVYYNRGADLLVQGRFSDALRCLQISCRLDRDDPIARRNTLACINNWALAECDAGAYQHAAERLIRGIELAPDYRPFWDNDLYVHHRWVKELCRSGEYSRALQVLEAAYQRRPSAPLFADGRRAVSDLWQRSRADAPAP